MELRGIHHLGVAVENLDEAIGTYGLLFGAELEHREAVPDQGVEGVSLRAGDSRIELLAPTVADSPIAKFLASRGPGLHHVAYEVSDIAGALEELAASGAQLIDLAPRRGLFGFQVAFVHPDSVHGVLTEVVSRV